MPAARRGFLLSFVQRRTGQDIRRKLLTNLRGVIDTETDTEKLMSALRESKRNAALTIAVGDISEVWDVNAVMGALSTYADESIAVATRHVLRKHAKAGRLVIPDDDAPETGSGYVILGLGKLGARELNYSSDVDLIVLYDPERTAFEG